VAVYIKDLSYGRFGNKLFFYNNLRQLAHFLNTNYGCDPFPGTEIFDGPFCQSPAPERGQYYTVIFKEIAALGREEGKKRLKELGLQYDLILSVILADMFYWLDDMNTREIFKVKNPPDLGPGKHVALHFRGTDYFSWDPRAILPVDFYFKGIREIKNVLPDAVFHLFTDDHRLDSYRQVTAFLRGENLSYVFGNIANPYEDFKAMTECDAIISAPSSYSTTAGFIGKEKLIVQSAQWINYKIEEKDPFWIGLINGGNKNYHLWKAL